MNKGNKNLLQKYPIIGQFLRFVVIGFLNTGIDFGILNLEMWIFSIYRGWPVFVFNVISFAIASTNSFFWNRLWAFKYKGEERAVFQYVQFIVVTIIGMGINSLIVYLGTTMVGARFGLSASLWANAVKVVATAVSLIWNFAGYKFFVFNPKKKVLSNV